MASSSHGEFALRSAERPRCILKWDQYRETKDVPTGTRIDRPPPAECAADPIPASATRITSNGVEANRQPRSPDSKPSDSESPPVRHAMIPFLLIAATGYSLPVSAQPNASQPTADQLQQANTAFVKGDWQTSLNQYIALANAFPRHALSQFRVGVSLLELGRPSEAEPRLRNGERLGIAGAQAGYRLAQTQADLKRPDSAMSELSR